MSELRLPPNRRPLRCGKPVYRSARNEGGNRAQLSEMVDAAATAAGQPRVGAEWRVKTHFCPSWAAGSLNKEVAAMPPTAKPEFLRERAGAIAATAPLRCDAREWKRRVFGGRRAGGPLKAPTIRPIDRRRLTIQVRRGSQRHDKRQRFSEAHASGAGRYGGPDVRAFQVPCQQPPLARSFRHGGQYRCVAPQRVTLTSTRTAGTFAQFRTDISSMPRSAAGHGPGSRRIRTTPTRRPSGELGDPGQDPASIANQFQRNAQANNDSTSIPEPLGTPRTSADGSAAGCQPRE
jgi:hypothetical protein